MPLEDWSELRELWSIYRDCIALERSFTSVFAREIAQEKWHEWPLQFHELILKMIGPENRPVTRDVFCNHVDWFCKAVMKAKAASDISLGGK